MYSVCFLCFWLIPYSIFVSDILQSSTKLLKWCDRQ